MTNVIYTHKIRHNIDIPNYFTDLQKNIDVEHSCQRDIRAGLKHGNPTATDINTQYTPFWYIMTNVTYTHKTRHNVDIPNCFPDLQKNIDVEHSCPRTIFAGLKHGNPTVTDIKHIIHTLLERYYQCNVHSQNSTQQLHPLLVFPTH